MSKMIASAHLRRGQTVRVGQRATRTVSAARMTVSYAGTDFVAVHFGVGINRLQLREEFGRIPWTTTGVYVDPDTLLEVLNA